MAESLDAVAAPMSEEDALVEVCLAEELPDVVTAAVAEMAEEADVADELLVELVLCDDCATEKSILSVEQSVSHVPDPSESSKCNGPASDALTTFFADHV